MLTIPPLFVTAAMLWAVAVFALFDFPRGNVWRWVCRSAAPAYVAILYAVVQVYQWSPADVSFFGRLGLITLALSWGGDVLMCWLIRRGTLARWTHLDILRP